MTKITKLVISDEVNCKFHDLDAVVRRKMVEALKFMVPYARHLPAFKLGRWDGKVAYCTLGGSTYVNLLDKVLPIIMENGYEIELEDQRQTHTFEFPEVHERWLTEVLDSPTWPKGHPAEGQEILLRDYQVEVINNFLQNPQCLQEIATGAGKTLMTATLSKLVETYGRSIIIVPNKSLVEQTESDYKNLGLDVGVFYGDRKEYTKTHTICTWQSLSILAKKSKWPDDFRTTPEMFLHDFLEGVVCVMVDEAHSSKADQLKELLTGPMANIPIRWGLTGTIPKDECDAYALYASLGNVVSRLAASDLMDRGVLANCHVNIMQLLDTKDYKTYQDEYKFLVEDQKRLEFLAEFIKETAKTGNTLILVDRITTGKELCKLIPESSFVSGSTKSKDRKDSYTEINEDECGIMVATYGVAAVGINIPRIFNLVLIEPGKSFVRVIQSIGRGIRKAKDKDFVNIWDITSNCKFSARQLTVRKKYYKEANYPFIVDKIDYLNGK